MGLLSQPGFEFVLVIFIWAVYFFMFHIESSSPKLQSLQARGVLMWKWIPLFPLFCKRKAEISMYSYLFFRILMHNVM